MRRKDASCAGNSLDKHDWWWDGSYGPTEHGATGSRRRLPLSLLATTPAIPTLHEFRVNPARQASSFKLYANDPPGPPTVSTKTPANTIEFVRAAAAESIKKTVFDADNPSPPPSKDQLCAILRVHVIFQWHPLDPNPRISPSHPCRSCLSSKVRHHTRALFSLQVSGY